MIKIDVLKSGSSGNCSIITIDNRKYMIDCGVNEKILNKIDLKNIDSVFITHEHVDHFNPNALSEMNLYEIPIFMTRRTLKYLVDWFGEKRCRNFVQIEGYIRELNNNGIRIFYTHHDAVSPIMLTFRDDGGLLLYATDTNYIHPISDITHLMIEANYEEKLLSKNNKYPESLKNRIRQNHYSIDDSINYIIENPSNLHEIHLMHLSKHNANKNDFVERVKKITGVPVFAHGA